MLAGPLAGGRRGFCCMCGWLPSHRAAHHQRVRPAATGDGFAVCRNQLDHQTKPSHIATTAHVDDLTLQYGDLGEWWS